MTKEVYEHGAVRQNNPTAEMTTTSHAEMLKPKSHPIEVKEKDHNIIPTLDWRRKKEKKTLAAPLLNTVEKIDPKAWIDTLSKQSTEPDLFASYDRYANPEKAKWEWYQHKGNWQNRLIHADAKRAMASLLEHEQMAGEVQCVYFDPPYGMDYDARFMDDSIQVTAFRDTYEGGIHTYLDGIRETALLARELLSETGSFFMQIGDINVHRCALILDEVFGPENHVSTITYATTGGGSSTKSISKSGDYILWYAKNREAPMCFQTLYEEQTVEEWIDTQTFAGGVDLPDGTSRPLDSKERRNPKELLPNGFRLWKMGGLLSQGPSKGEQGKPFIYQGVQYGPKALENNQWRVDLAGLNHLANSGRLWSNVKCKTKFASALQLYCKIYQSEMPGTRVTNLWSKLIRPSDKRYAVQTGDPAIQRCILMTTKPGDLVLDPTSGGGTTAVVSETWGRRWICIDSSRESLAVSRERVLVHDYPNHSLLGSDIGFKEENKRRIEAGQELLKIKPEGELDPATGFVYDRIPYVSAATLAYANRPDKKQKKQITWLVDRTAGSKNGRVCSKFTVETELIEVYQRPEDMVRPSQAHRDMNWQNRIIQMLDETGVRSDSGQLWQLEGVESILSEQQIDEKRSGLLSHSAILVDSKTGRKEKAVIGVWPEDAKIDISAMQLNVRAAMKRNAGEILVVVGAEFADGTEPGHKGHKWAIEVMRVKAGPELHLTGVKDKAKTSSLVLVAEPAVKLETVEKDLFKCTLCGWNEFNPVTANAQWHSTNNVQMWMLDTEYDSTQFYARRIHLPHRLRKKENRKVLEGLLGRECDSDALNATFGWTSQPFSIQKNQQIALRVITTGGGMMSWSGPALPNIPA